MKKTISLFLALILAFSLATVAVSASAEAEGQLRIVTTIFPEYDWVMNILGDRAAAAVMRCSGMS